MKQFIHRCRRNVFVQALYSGSLLALFIYGVVRGLFYEFPLTWSEECFFFFKTFTAASFLIATATAGTAWLYGFAIKVKARRSAA